MHQLLQSTANNWFKYHCGH